jgi:hypothetical protein
MTFSLQTDSNGNVISFPVTEWQLRTLAGISILLTALYVRTPEELETEDRQQIQLAMTPQQCLQLAEALKKAAMSLLEDQSHAAKPLN